MKNSFYYLGFLILLILSGSCRKNELADELSDKISAKTINLKSVLASTSAIDFENHDDDSIERQTTLGSQLTNPYLI